MPTEARLAETVDVIAAQQDPAAAADPDVPIVLRMDAREPGGGRQCQVLDRPLAFPIGCAVLAGEIDALFIHSVDGVDDDVAGKGQHPFI